MSYTRESLRKRFETKFKVSENGCWEWEACKHGRGYGYFYTHPDYSKRKMDFAHRVSLFIYKGEKPPDDLCVRHKCDNTSCVNPDHLVLGTHQQNMEDMMVRGRYKPPNQRYTERDSILAQKMREAGFSLKDIASLFNCHTSHASRLSRGLIKNFNNRIEG